MRFIKKLTVLSTALVAVAGATGSRYHEVTYLGTVTAVGSAGVDASIVDERTGESSPMTFAVREATEIYRGDHRMTFGDARIVVDERIAVTVNTDVPGNVALVIRLADHHE